METTYNPYSIESKYRQIWQDNNCFSANINQNSDKTYCIMLPPPNVTGSLHMGHAFQHTVMDVLTRYHRMLGEQTLWQPGTDHAGIATQMVVERQLNAKGIQSNDLSREVFTDKIWQWKQESGGIITQQMRRLGVSVDWSRERFTLDENLSKAVNEVFVQLHQEGLIYRGNRLVNWDPVLLTAVSDLEVINTEEQGSLWHIRYPITNSDQTLVVATTRPETMLGDSCVAVHPEDKRYQHLIGQTIDLPLSNRSIPIIADTYVDKDFGTGCVKITPAHDFNDYEIGKRHNLAFINIFTKNAHIVSEDIIPTKYQGLDRFVARKKIIADLKDLGLLAKIEPHTLKTPRGDRTNSVIEPYLTEQWFVKIAPLAQPAIDAVKNGNIRFIPQNWDKTYFNWMDNIQDWCISRQIIWGHRIPAWYDVEGNVFVAKTKQDAQQQAGDDRLLSQDNDVLDTWFSSALWPFSTLGWPDKTIDLEQFYPTSVLVTGFDIIFFWVARMIMFGLKFTGKVPFKDIYITGLIRDAQGQKMSKSKGNVIDPIDIVDGISLEDLLIKRSLGLMQPKMQKKITNATKKTFPKGIPAFGTDAIRFAFTAMASFGRDISFDLKRVEGYRNFCNKLWNASRFVLNNLDNKHFEDSVKPTHHINQWILSKLEQTRIKTQQHLAEYRLDLMAQNLYDFVWHDYCDWYLEFSKPLLANPVTKNETQHTLAQTLAAILKLLHPIIPFITEEIYASLNADNPTQSLLIISQYPTAHKTHNFPEAQASMNWLQTFILGIRQIRGEMNISTNKTLSCLVSNFNPLDKARLESYQVLLKKVAKIDTIILLAATDKEPESAIALLEQMKILIPLAGLIDKNQEIKRLNKELDKLNKLTQQFKKKLGNEKFISNAPQDIIVKEKEKLTTVQKTIDGLNKQLETFVSI